MDYQRYLASREWAILREQVRQRSGDRCEHCGIAPQHAVHHLTYERMGHEELDDLMAACNPCHEWLSGKSNDNPLIQWAVVTPPFGQPAYHPFHYLIPYDRPAGLEGWMLRVSSRRCTEQGCIWCAYINETMWPFLLGKLHFIFED